MNRDRSHLSASPGPRNALLSGLDRRDFLMGTAALAGTALASTAGAQGWSSSADDRRHLVHVFLNGGNDALNTLVPHRDKAYYAARPALAIPRERLHLIDEGHGLHPALERLAARYGAGGVGFLRGVGYRPPNMSHFTSRDIWDSAQLNPTGARSGWIGRMTDALLGEEIASTAMISVGAVATPFSMRAERNTAYAVPDTSRYKIKDAPVMRGEENNARRRALDALNRASGAGRAAEVAGSVEAAAESIELLSKALRRPTPVEYPQSKLARDLQVVARAIDAELPTYAFHVDQPGYDTHAVQAENHAELLSTLDAGLDAFLSDLTATRRIDRTLVLVYSEFGRRVAENGIGAGAGTDHGAAGLIAVLGGGAKPGLHGPEFDLRRLDRPGNMIPAVDFRAVYADVIETWFGLPSAGILGREIEPAGIVAS